MKTYKITGYLTQFQRDELREKQWHRRKWIAGIISLLCFALAALAVR